MNPGSSIQLKSIGGRQTIENVPCDKNKTNTGQMLIKIVNHLNNEGYKNPYGHNSGTEGVHRGIRCISTKFRTLVARFND
jgi:hypothetical protein